MAASVHAYTLLLDTQSNTGLSLVFVTFLTFLKFVKSHENVGSNTSEHKSASISA
jgi:hypothetical protein